MSAGSPTRHSALLTDLYELTMAAAYFENQFNPSASFELFVRSLPPERGYLLAAGLEQALDYLETLAFTDAEVDFLRRHPVFSHVSDAFFDYLRGLRFTGEVWAAPEGTVVFADEPLLRVTAPIIEAQIVETFLLASLSFQTLVATKAARVVEAAAGRGVVEFGTRRAHGPEAGVLAARAAYLGGCIGTSNVEAGHRFGIPTYGTVAHSFVMAYADEEESFRRFLRVFPEHAILLVDTYDTLAAVDRILASGLRPKGVRLDSGNLVELSKEARRRLDRGGLTETKMFASGDLNEHAIAELLARGAAIDAFGVGTELATSKDAPALGAVYKLVAVHEGPESGSRVKLSEDKATYPGPKQVFRFHDANGRYDHDVVGRDVEAFAEAEPLLAGVMRGGRRLALSPPLNDIRQRAKANLERLPAPCRAFRDPAAYPVRFSRALEELQEEVRQKVYQPAGRKSSHAR
ncbi:MAG: nicotinate phosphoribosyltransferase [Candidatus Acidiferrales bacterium]